MSHGFDWPIAAVIIVFILAYAWMVVTMIRSQGL